MPKKTIRPDERHHQFYNKNVVDVSVPRETETESHVEVVVKTNDKLGDIYEPIDDTFVVDKGTHEIVIRPAPDMTELDIRLKGTPDESLEDHLRRQADKLRSERPRSIIDWRW